jgi:hypothetical protein
MLKYRLGFQYQYAYTPGGSGWLVSDPQWLYV